MGAGEAAPSPCSSYGGRSMGCDAEDPSARPIGGSRWQWLSVVGGELGEEMGIKLVRCGDGLGFSSAITGAGPPKEARERGHRREHQAVV